MKRKKSAIEVKKGAPPAPPVPVRDSPRVDSSSNQRDRNAEHFKALKKKKEEDEAAKRREEEAKLALMDDEERALRTLKLKRKQKSTRHSRARC